MNRKQRPIDFLLLASGIFTIVGSISPWFSITFINVAGIDTWWGFLTIVSGVLVAVSASVRIWPNLIDLQLHRGLKVLSIVGVIAAIATVSYVGIRLSEVSQSFDEPTGTENSTTETTMADDVFGEFATDFEKSLEEFTDVITDAFRPRLGGGWYVTLGSSLVSFALLVRRPRRSPPLPQG